MYNSNNHNKNYGSIYNNNNTYTIEENKSLDKMKMTESKEILITKQAKEKKWRRERIEEIRSRSRSTRRSVSRVDGNDYSVTFIYMCTYIHMFIYK